MQYYFYRIIVHYIRVDMTYAISQNQKYLVTLSPCAQTTIVIKAIILFLYV